MKIGMIISYIIFLRVKITNAVITLFNGVSNQVAMKTKYYIIFAIVIILIGIRIWLPYGVKNYINKTLVELPGYTGKIEDVDIALFRGAYVIDGLQVLKEDGDYTLPFISVDRIDFSIQWNALFKGKLVGEVIFDRPTLRFLDHKQENKDQYGEGVDWTEPVKKWIPVKINKLLIQDGKVYFKNPTSKPDVDLYISGVKFEINNLRNADKLTSKLPSDFYMSGVTIGDGALTAQGKINVLKPIPDFDLSFKLESVDIVALNDFLKVYSNVDAEKGNFSLYSEIAIDDAMISGYVKPIIKDLKIIDLTKDSQNPVQLVWESIVAAVTSIFTNHNKDQFASKVPFEGSLKDPDVKIFQSIWNVFRNAFVKAFKNKVDDAITFPLNNEQAEKEKN